MAQLATVKVDVPYVEKTLDVNGTERTSPMLLLMATVKKFQQAQRRQSCVGAFRGVKFVQPQNTQNIFIRVFWWVRTF